MRRLGALSKPLFRSLLMHAISLYNNKNHRHQVIELWERIFGYEASHNSPNLAIDRKLAANESVYAFYESQGYAVEKRITMGKQIPQNIPINNLSEAKQIRGL